MVIPSGRVPRPMLRACDREGEKQTRMKRRRHRWPEKWQAEAVKLGRLLSLRLLERSLRLRREQSELLAIEMAIEADRDAGAIQWETNRSGEKSRLSLSDKFF